MARRSRIKCDSLCVLNCNGSSYSVILENLSLEGALLKTNNKLLNQLKPNDVCDLMLCNDPNVCPTKYSCKVVRFDSEGIGVQFMGLNGLMEW
jgi:hypothetical protein